MSYSILYYYPKSHIARRENLEGKVLQVYTMTLKEVKQFCSLFGAELVVRN